MPLWVGTVSTSQIAVTLCSWGVKTGMVRVSMAGKTMWFHCYTRAIFERCRDKGLIIKCWYISSSLYFTLLLFYILLRKNLHISCKDKVRDCNRYNRMAKVPNGVETLPKISIAWVGCTNITDDRQTDDRWHIANMNLSSRSLKITCAKMHLSDKSILVDDLEDYLDNYNYNK